MVSVPLFEEKKKNGKRTAKEISNMLEELREMNARRRHRTYRMREWIRAAESSIEKGKEGDDDANSD